MEKRRREDLEWAARYAREKWDQVRTGSATEALLAASLEAAVPLRCLELRHLGFEARKRIAQECFPTLLEHGDDAMFKSVRRGDSARAFYALVTILAVLAFAPGGVKALGMHFECR